MPSGATEKFGSLRSFVDDCPLPPMVGVLMPPRLRPIVKPACICHLFEKRFVPVNSTPW